MLRIGADFDEYRAHYALSKRDYYGILRIEHDATAAETEAAFNQLAQFLKSEIDKGDNRAEAYMREARRAKEALLDPVRRAQYDEDLRVKAFHVSGERSVGQICEEARLDELRKWSYHEGERQRAKERAERRAREQAGLEASEEDCEGADADSGAHHRRQSSDAQSAKQAEEEGESVRAEKERRAADEWSRKRQIDEFVTEKLAVESRKVQTEADLRVVLEERNKAKEAHEARLDQRKAIDEKKRKRNYRHACSGSS